MAEWYAADGLQFECTECGACCTGPPGYVAVSDDEAEAIAARLGIDVDTFWGTYTRDDVNGPSLREQRSAYGWDCIFLDRTTVPGRAICSVYEARPLQCRTFPWWPEHLRSPKAWARLGRQCEGIGRGAFVPVEHIRIERDRQAARTPDVGRA
jgi:Fe-S-cluster containining protein